MTNLHMNVVTYVPKGQKVTKLESVGKLIPSITEFAKHHDNNVCKLILNVLVNNSDESIILDNLLDSLKHLLSYKVEIRIFHSNENNLMLARNTLLYAASTYSGENFVTQFDDDDRLFDHSYITIDSFMKRSSEAQFRDRLNFFMFLWERLDGTFLMPKDLKSKSIDRVAKSIFTFSNWGWIAYVPYLVNNFIMYPDSIESPYMDDNYFIIRAFIVNRKSNFITSPFYIWNNVGNPNRVSKIHDKFLDTIFRYFRTGSVGFDADVYSIINSDLVRIYDTSLISYPLDFLYFIIKGDSNLYNTGQGKILFDYAEMRYKLVTGEPLRVISTVEEYIKNNSVYQFISQSKLDPSFNAIRNLVLEGDDEISHVIKGSPYLYTLITEMI